MRKLKIYHTRDQVHVFVWSKNWLHRAFLALSGLFQRTITGTNGPEGRLVTIWKGTLMYGEKFTDTEWVSVLVAQDAHRKSHEVEVEAKKKTDAEAKAKEDAAWVEARDRAAKEFIKEHGPNPGNWPTYAVPVRPLRQRG